MTNNLEGGKSLLTRIKNNTDVSKHLIDLLYKKPDLSFNEAEFLFSVALLLIEEYQKTRNHEKYLLIEYAYLIIAVTCFKTNDFKALYDFSVNYGYYPTARTILESGLIKDEEVTINHLISDLEIDKFVDENKVKTYEQNKVFEEILASNFKQLSFIAPTSYGKSELVFQHIKKNNECNFIAIIVPTKALIDQTFRAAKRNISDRKIIVHDQNYDSEKDARVLAIVTQERGLRLIEEGIVFDLIYIDEAHELLDFNFSNLFSNRSLLLSRFIKLSIMRKPELKIIYLSPSIQNSKNLSLRNQGAIQSYRIEKNLFNPGNNVKRLRYDATIDYYRRFLEFSFNGLNERIEDLYKYWTEDILGNSSRKDLNYYVYVGRQFGEVAYYETEAHQGQKVYVDLRTHKYDEDYLYNLAVIKIQTDEDFINHEITLLLSTLKEFEIITENQFNYFLYGTFDKKEIEVLRLGISRNIYQSLKANNQIENIGFDEFGNTYANEHLKSYIDKKTGIEKFELEQFFL